MSESVDPRTPRRDPEIAHTLRSRISAPPLRPGFRDELWARVDAQESGAPGSADTATAADMLQAMSSAAAGGDTVRLHITATQIEPSRSTGSVTVPEWRDVQEQVFTMDSLGDWHLLVTRSASSSLSDPKGWEESYDATTHARRFRLLGRSGKGPGKEALCKETRPTTPMTSGDPRYAGDELDYGGPDMEYSGYTASVRAAVAAADPDQPVASVTFAGRPAWRARFPVQFHRDSMDADSPLMTIGTVTAVVDRETGLTLLARFDYAQSGTPWGEIRVDRMELQPDLAAGWNNVQFPPQAPLTVLDPGTRFGTVAEVAQRSWPTLPLVPAHVPAGYHLVAASTSGMDFIPPYAQPQLQRRTEWRVGSTVYRRPYWTAPNALVQLVYRNGFSQFAIGVSPLPSPSYDSLGSTDRPGAEDATLSDGALKGQPSRNWVTPYNGLGPVLLTYSARSQVAIWGDLTRQELLDIANSLQAVGDADKPLTGRL